MALDPRLHAFRPDLADERLRGQVDAARFVAGATRTVIVPSAPMKRIPRADAGVESEALRGERFVVFEDAAEGWSWGQLETDGYVGYVPSDALAAGAPQSTHRVAALRTFVYPGPDMKLPPLSLLSFASRVACDDEATTRGTLYRRLSGGEGWIVASTLEAIDTPPAADFVLVAERFLNTAYLWGGRTSVGLDCSALVQLSLMAAGVPAPRDTDLQQQMVGEPVAGDARQRGDLVFWPGHVGIMIDGEYLIHANGHHMAVVIEALEAVNRRIASPSGEPSARRPA